MRTRYGQRFELGDLVKVGDSSAVWEVDQAFNDRKSTRQIVHLHRVDRPERETQAWSDLCRLVDRKSSRGGGAGG